MGTVVKAQNDRCAAVEPLGLRQLADPLAALRQQPAGAANPFVIGTPAVSRALNVMGECAQAQRDRFAMQ
jgi:metallo-beta-lactamase class B